MGNLFDGDRANPRGLIDLNQLFGGGIRPGDDDVAQQHGKRLIAYKFGCNQHSVTEAQRFFLPRVTERDHAAELANHFRKIWAAAVGEKTFQAGKRIEVVLDGVLAFAGDDDDVFDAAGDALFHHVLHQRLIHNGEHFLRLSFCGRKKTCAHAGRRQHGLTDSLGKGRHAHDCKIRRGADGVNRGKLPNCERLKPQDSP